MKANNEDIVIERTKSGNKKSGSFVVIGIAVLVLIFVMALCAAISHFSGMTAKDFDKNSSNGELIYDSLPDSIVNIEKYASGTILLTDTSLDYLNHAGERMSANSHSYSQPVIDIKNRTVLIYDKGGLALRIEKNMTVYNSLTVNKPIITASVGKKGNYAYVLNEDGGYQSHLYVYSLQGKKQFEWGSASDYCITTALSDNGKSIAVALAGVKNGEYVSVINFFNFNDSKALYSVELEDCTVVSLEFINNKTIAVLTDNGIFVINKKGECEKIADYLPSEILHSDFAFNGLNAVSTVHHGNVRETKLCIFNKKFKELYTLDFDSEIFSVKASDKYVAVLFNNRINVYDVKGNMISEILLDEKCADAVFSGNTLYVLTAGGIYSFNAHTDYDLTIENLQGADEGSSAEAVETTSEEASEEYFG